MGTLIRTWLVLALVFACLGGGPRASGSDGERICSQLVIQLQANREAQGSEVIVQLELANAGKEVLYLFDDTLLADAFQVRGGVLSYDISVPFYLEMADVVLSKAHIQQQPKYQRLSPGESLRRQLTWAPRNRQERKAHLESVLVRATFSDHLPEGSGIAFAQAFGSAPSGCTREVRIVLGQP